MCRASYNAVSAGVAWAEAALFGARAHVGDHHLPVTGAYHPTCLPAYLPTCHIPIGVGWGEVGEGPHGICDP